MPRILPFSQWYHVRVEISAGVCPETGFIIDRGTRDKGGQSKCSLERLFMIDETVTWVFDTYFQRVDIVQYRLPVHFLYFPIRLYRKRIQHLHIYQKIHDFWFLRAAFDIPPLKYILIIGQGVGLGGGFGRFCFDHFEIGACEFHWQTITGIFVPVLNIDRFLKLPRWRYMFFSIHPNPTQKHNPMHQTLKG